MPEQTSTVVMAFDYGTTEIGIAVGQTITNTAQGVKTLNVSGDTPPWRELVNVVKEHQPGTLLVGLPINMDGTESDMSRAARNFASEMATRTGLPVELEDERLTTREAKSGLADARAAGIAQTDHELAACLIAESWLSNRG